MSHDFVLAVLFFYGLLATFWIFVLTLQLKRTRCQAAERVSQWRGLAKDRLALAGSKDAQDDNLN